MPDSRTSSLHSASKAAQEAAHLHLDGDAASHRHPDPALDLDRNGATPAASAPRSTNIRHVPALDHSSSSSSCSHLQQEQHESQSQSQPIVTRTRFGHLRSETLRYLSQTIHHDDATIPLAWHCFLTGAIDAIVYARTGIWVAFQTGNMVQFSQNISQYILPQTASLREPLPTLERALSVSSFFLAGLFASRLAPYLGGSSRRLCLVVSSLLQCALLWGAAGILLAKPEGADPTYNTYPPMIVLTALSMGMQSLTAQKLASPGWATTVAYTATLTQLASDPYLFIFSSSPATPTRARNLRALSVLMLCFGAGVGDCWLHTDLGFRGGLAVCAAAKLLLAGLWLVPKGQVAAAAA